MLLQRKLRSPSSRMKDYARADSGAKIVMASCCDERHPPENVLDGKDSTFWSLTGMYPQEFIVAFPSPLQISKITTLSLDGALEAGGA